MRSVDQFGRAAKAWPIPVECAARRSTIRYGDLADRLGIHVRPLRFVLAKIQDHCLHECLPPLTILVVNAKGRQGTGFIAWDPNDVDSGFDRVYGEDWSARNSAFLMDPGITERDLVRRLRDPTTAEDVLRLVRSRGVAQILFRELIREAYGNRCAVSGSRIREGLEAAHIVPWSACKSPDRLNVRNGILLTVWHHRLFDRASLRLTLAIACVW